MRHRMLIERIRQGVKTTMRNAGEALAPTEFEEGRANRVCGGESRGRTDTHSEVRQILSLVRLPIPPFRHGVGLYRV